ncbi:pyrroline-5-carboxylate reductase family protein [Sphingomonas sp. R86521]|uniref:pyrroline-5-carboxylate reductase family protein n=1 Tax=Sphingomonas sp. R86521 TaxID=3093860 RepID=UPI0036D2D1C9
MIGSGGPIWLIGCGNMGGAMLRRWIAAGLDPQRVTVITRSGAGAPDGVRSLSAVPDEPAPDTLMLALKPQQIDAAQAMIAPLQGRPKLLLSILAGVDHATLAERFAAEAIVRAMPNLPVAIGKGVTTLYTVGADAAAIAQVEALAAPLGLYEWIGDEKQYDAVTALAGCGPGFVFRFADALAQAGAALGLPADQAARLAIATLEGSAIMAADADVSPAVLADRVASPSGSTREGLNVLDRNDALVRLLTDTLAAAAARNAEMAAAARR